MQSQCLRSLEIQVQRPIPIDSYALHHRVAIYNTRALTELGFVMFMMFCWGSVCLNAHAYCRDGRLRVRTTLP